MAVQDKDVAAILEALNIKDGKKKITGIAKNLTLFILAVAFGFGVYGSFNAANFNIDNYVNFLGTFAWFFAPLIISIGAGSATKNLSGKSDEESSEK